MSSAVPRLPDQQLAALARAYSDALAQKRRQLLLGLAIFAMATVVACIVAEVRPAAFVTNLWRFTDYIGRIFTLDNGPNSGRIVLVDLSLIHI